MLRHEEKINELIPVGNPAEWMNKQCGGADEEADMRRERILNTTDTLSITGTTYYLSPDGDDNQGGTSPETAWKSIEGLKAHAELLKPGDGVLFERNGVYRGHFDLTSGVTYGAYGVGRKPAIYGSRKNLAQPELWVITDTENVWMLNEDQNYDVGYLVFDHGSQGGNRKHLQLSGLAEDLDFYCDWEACRLYMYSVQNPGDRFQSIELCDGTRNILQGQPGCHDVTIDNLTVKYGGGHGIHFAVESANITIRNCEIGWIGGCILIGFKDNTFRFGNAIEFWRNCSDVLVENNWVYQVYDAGITHQGVGEDLYHRNVVYRGNLVEYCTYGFEFFLSNPSCKMQHILYEDNMVRFAGLGWGICRPNPQKDALICGWGDASFQCEDFVIRGNVFDVSANYLLVQYYRTKMPFEYYNNTFYQRAGRVADWFDGEQLEATDQESLEKAISRIDASPAKVMFME